MALLLPSLDVPRLLLTGALALEDMRPAAAHQAAAAILARDAENPRAWALLGAVWEALQRPEDAEDAYEQALNRDDRDLPSALALVRLYQARGRLKEAQALRTFALVHEHGAPELRSMLMDQSAARPSRLPPEDVEMAGRVRTHDGRVVFYPSSLLVPPVELPQGAVPLPHATQQARARRKRGSTTLDVPSLSRRQARMQTRDARTVFIAVTGPASVEDPFTGEVFAAAHQLPPGTVISSVSSGAGQARVIGDTLAEAGTPRAREFLLSARRGLTPHFPPAALTETEHLLTHHGIDDPALTDLTAEPFFAIDNADSRDIDQLMCLRREGPGYLVFYALADAAHYVRPGMALHEEAIARGTSFYMPGLNVPMLPRELSEGLISLLEGQDRRALVVRLVLDAAGRPTQTSMIRARVHNHHQLTYVRVQRHFDGVEKIAFKHPGIEPQLGLLQEIGQKRIADALQRGVIPFFRIEARKHLSEDGNTFVIRASRPLDVERYNSEISVVTNVQGALELVHSAMEALVLPAIYRNHPPPPEVRVEALRRMLHRIVDEHRLPDVWKWAATERLGAYVQRLRTLPQNALENRVARALDRQTVLVNQRGMFGTSPQAHHGLMAKAYARLTAPMREVVGIETHQRIISRTILARVVEMLPSLPPPDRTRLQQLTILSLAGPATDQERALVRAFLALDGWGGDPLRTRAEELLAQLASWPGVDETVLATRQQQLLQRVAESGNLAADMQRQVDKDVDGLILDQLFTPQLALPLQDRTLFTGTVMGVSPAKIYVQLDEPYVEVKIYVADLARRTGATWVLDADGVELRRRGSSTADITVGHLMTLRLVEKSTRWVLLPLDQLMPVQDPGRS